jgi:AraC-like DNA-binding protein
MRNPPDMRLYEGADRTQLPFINVLGTGDEDPTEVVCGFFGCDNRPFNPLLAGLPRMLHVKGDALPGKAWLPLFSEIAAEESRARRSGGENVLSRMSELMFVELIRAYVASLPEGQTGWLAGLRDRAVGSALNLLHGRPAHDWTLDELARESGLSRSSFVDRFTALIGQPPMQYLASWRMQLAANRLLNGTDNVAKVAADVGYESEAAFSRAFKRVVGMSPAAWRKAER